MRRIALLLMLVPLTLRADEAAVKKALAEPLVGPRQSLLETQDYLEPKLVPMPVVESAAAWTKTAEMLRKQMLDRVVLRGEAKQWSRDKLAVEFLDGKLKGEGYQIRKLRFEAIKGLWIPALLYEPVKLDGKVPVMLAVNGHDPKGKAADYKQIRCINLAKRGMLVLNVEWFGMGQLRTAGNRHGCMNQLDLCGTSGLAPFYLAMTRGIDVLLSQPNADEKRVAVSGLSGGGWQTIVISSLDTRVTLANPVAGYSGFRVRLRDHFKDLGDSEQTPVDMGIVADYTHLTAMRAPRPTLLTYNAKDNCCFEAGYALPPLMKAAEPMFKLFGQEKALRSHVNHDPGTHNFEKENREQLYKMVGDFFYPKDEKFSAKEIPCEKEIRSAEDLAVELPKDNESIHSLALTVAKTLPRNAELPTTADKARDWQTTMRKKLAGIVHAHTWSVEAKKDADAIFNGTQVKRWKLQVGKAWSVGVVELSRGKPTNTTITLNDAGRKTDIATVERLLKAGHRVLAVDLYYFGESRIFTKDYLFALLVSAAGERPLGIQASQLTAVARWAKKEYGNAIQVCATGPRTSLIALTAAALETDAIGSLELTACRGSLKEVIEENRTVDQMPEMFCFGLLEAFEVQTLAALTAPREIVFKERSKRLESELRNFVRFAELLRKR